MENNMRKRMFTILGFICLLLAAVVIIIYFANPGWRNTTDGIWKLIVAILTGIFGAISAVKGIIEIIDKAKQSDDPKINYKPIENIILAHVSPEMKGALPKGKILHNLPQPDYGEFIGREEDIKTIVNLLRPYPDSKYFTVTINGIGGIGKSTLALEIAFRYFYNHDNLPARERFDAIIWISAKENVLTADGIKTRPQVRRSLADIYAAIAETLQLEKITRAKDEKEQAGLVRAELANENRRILMIMDNLETVDDEKVNTFIREIPPPTKVIITTRHLLDTSFPVRLTGMPTEDALKLMALECTKKGVNLSEKEKKRLLERTGGVPLAIVWSIGLMGMGLGIERVLHKLGNSEEKIAEFCFKASVETIKDEIAYKVLLATALFTNDASRDALGSITGASIMDRDEGLSHLEVLSLVNKQADRFKLLPLTKTYVLGELRKNQELGLKLSRCWIDYLKTICSGVDSEYYWRYRSYAFYREGDTILDAIQWCRKNGPVEDAIFLTYAAYDFLETAGRWSEILVLVEDTLGIAETLKNETAIARLCSILAWIFMQQGELKKAETLYIKSLEKYKSQNNEEGETIVLQHLCAVYRKRREFDKAEEYLHQAQAIDNRLGIGDLHTLVKTEQGKLARGKQDWPEAKRIFTEISEYFEKRVEGTPRDESLARGNWGHLAIVVYHLGNYEEAKELCLKSIEFFESSGTKGYRCHYS
jgi:tetratricopeptide (TPR) repeat protein